MSLTKLLPVILLMMATGVQASTRDEIERLWNPQGMAVQPAQPAADTSARTEKPAPRWFRLSNGRQVNLADWKVVLFMQGHCPYCHQFDPVLKQLAQQFPNSLYLYHSCTNFVFVRPPYAKELYDYMLDNSVAIRYMGDYLRITAGSPQENETVVRLCTQFLSEKGAH